MKVHISTYRYPTKARAKTAGKLICDLLSSCQDVSINMIIQNILSQKVIIPAELSTYFYDINSYNLLNDSISNLILSVDELNDIVNCLNKHSQYVYKDINFSKSLLNLIQPNSPFIINHRFCWTSQSLFIINIHDFNLITKAKSIGLAFWYQPIYPENSYNLVFITEKITDYRIAYLINQSLNHYLDNISTIDNSDLSSYFYGCLSSHSGFKSINTKLDINKLLRNIQQDFFKLDPQFVLDYVTNFEAKVRLRHCKLKLERVFHLFASHKPEYFLEKDNPYYTEFSDLGFMFLHRSIESKLEKIITASQVTAFPYVDLNFSIDPKYINIPLKSARRCCALLNDFMSKNVSQEDIDLIISNIRYLKFGVREALNLISKEKVFWSLSHFNKRISCDKCIYKNNCSSQLDLYSHLLSLEHEYTANLNYLNNCIDKSNTHYLSVYADFLKSNNHILINNADLSAKFIKADDSITFSNILPYDDIILDSGNMDFVDIPHVSKITTYNSYMPYLIPKMRPKYVYLDDSFIFSALIKVFKLPGTADIITVKNCLLTSDLSLSVKDKILLVFNQIANISRLTKLAVNFTDEETNDIVSILKAQKFHYIWYYLWQNKSVFLFKELNLYSPGLYTVYYFYFNQDIFDYPTKFIINSSFDYSFWQQFNVEYQEVRFKLDNVYLHPQYSFSYSQMKAIKHFDTSEEYRYIKKFISDRDVIITHKSMFEYLVQNGFIRVSSNIYLGCNRIKNLNNNLAIIGTPRLKEVYYFALALLAGESLDKLKCAKFGSYKLVYKGTSFPFRSYSLPILNNLMCMQIEAELRKLITCAGDGFTVNIFSSFYLPGSQVIW